MRLMGGRPPRAVWARCMILYGLRAGSPVVTDTGCCLSAAWRRRPDFGTKFDSAACIISAA